jgi:Tol biopolymer transport system component
MHLTSDRSPQSLVRAGRPRRAIGAAAWLVSLVACWPAAAQVQEAVARPPWGPTTLGTLGDGDSSPTPQAMSEDGRYVIFGSRARNLLPDEGNPLILLDRTTGVLSRPTNCAVSGSAAISADARFIAFTATPDCVSGATGSRFSDLFVVDRVGGGVARINVGTGGVQANADAGGGLAISLDGNIVAFDSTAGNLVAGDTNGVGDIFIRDRAASTTTRISIATGGAQANGPSRRPGISGDGRYVVFESSASNLVANDTNGVDDIFLHDRVLVTTTRWSTSNLNAQGDGPSREPVISLDGSTIVFHSSASTLVPGATSNRNHVYAKSRQSGAISRISRTTTDIEANGSVSPGTPSSVSRDGRFVAFATNATNLLPSDPRSNTDIYVRDTVNNTLVLASANLAGVSTAYAVRTGLCSTPLGEGGSSLSPVLSADGGTVLFSSTAPDLVAGDANGRFDVFRRDLAAGTTTILSRATATFPSGITFVPLRPALAGDGRHVAYVQGDPVNNRVMRYDRAAGITREASADSQGRGYGATLNEAPAVTADGRFVFFVSDSNQIAAGNCGGTGLFRKDLDTGAALTVESGISSSSRGSFAITPDGAFVAYEQFGTLWRENVATGARDSVGQGFMPSISADGRFVAYATFQPIDVADSNFRDDVYLRDLVLGTTRWLSRGTGGAASNSDSRRPWVSASGRYVAFESLASNLVAGDNNNEADLFRYDLATDTLSRITRSAPGGGIAKPQLGGISADGRFIVFASGESDHVVVDPNPSACFVDSFVYDAFSGATRIVSVDAQGRAQSTGPATTVGALQLCPLVAPAISLDGRFVAFEGFGANWNVFDGYRPGQNLFVARVPAVDVPIQIDAPLPPPPGDGNDQNGTAIAMSGEFIVVGAANEGPGATAGAGAIYVYRRAPGGGAGAAFSGAEAKNLTLVATLRPPAGNLPGDKFGAAVALAADGGSIAVGAPGAAGGSGRVFMFQRPAGGWADDSTPDSTVQPIPFSGDVPRGFGASVAMADNGLLLVGAPQSDVAGAPGAGVAYAFLGGTANTRIAPQTPVANGKFGTAVTADGDKAAIGEPDDGPGAVHVYGTDGGLAQFETTVAPAGGAVGDKFGSAVSMDDGLLVAGAPGRSGGTGGGTVFEMMPGGLEERSPLTVPPSEGAGSGAGSAVLVTDGAVLLGAPLADVDGKPDQGRTFVFNEPPSGWSGPREADLGLTNPGGQPNERSGSALAAGGGGLSIGAPLRDVESVTANRAAKALLVDQGQVDTFRLDIVYRDGFEPR